MTELKQYTAAFFYSPFSANAKEQTYLKIITASSERNAQAAADATVQMNDDFLIAQILPQGHEMQIGNRP